MLSRRAVVRGLAGVGASTAGMALTAGCGLMPFASQSAVAHLGLMWTGSEATRFLPAAWRDGLREAGWVEGENLVIEERSYQDQPERIPDLVAELVASKPEVLLAGATDVAQALARASDSTPIVFGGLVDPVAAGLIASYARPGGNLTGTSRTGAGSLGPKLLDLLRQLVPDLTRVDVVYELRAFGNDWYATQTAAASVGIEAQPVPLASTEDLERALETVAADRPQALLVYIGGGVLIPATGQLALSTVADFALQHGLPSITTNQPARSALLFYGAQLAPLFRRAGNYHVDRILRGARPADLPVEGPTVFDLTINRTTARSLGVTVPPEFAAQVTQWVD
jgi:putative ABC transport system substrate-binding protein